MIKRLEHLSAIRTALKRSRIVALTGPRQCGKTTLERIAVVYPGSRQFPLTDKVSVVPLAAVVKGMAGLFP